MRKISSPQAESATIPCFAVCKRPFSFPPTMNAVLLTAVACALLAVPMPLCAQSSAPASPVKTPVHHHRRPTKPQAVPTPAPVEPAPVTPPVPEQPKWPVNDPAGQASVVWDSRGLKIDAANSSLQQILGEVSLQTGVKVDGLSTDQRVFGEYGPGQARDVLSQLLQGSGYNVIMIGDQGQGTPRQVLLSTRQTASAQPAPRYTPPSSDEDVEPEEQPAQPESPVNRPPFPPGAPPRSPQQFEMQQRLQQQLQQQQPQPAPQTNPPN